MMRNLTDGEWETVRFCLDVAASRYSEDAKVCKEANQVRLAEQFERQEKKARELLDKIGGVP
jgi:hypothetical protein